MAVHNLSKTELRAACATIRALLAAGKLDDEVIIEMGITWDDYDKLKAKMVEQEADTIRSRTTEEVYVDYCIKQETNVRDLTELITTCKGSKQHNAMVGAIRARSDIYNQMIAKGQEFGLIAKEPEKQLVLGGLLVANLSNEELRSAITGSISELATLVTRFGDGVNIIDMNPGQIHRALPVPKVKALSKRNKVHGGRKVVKIKATK